MPRFVLNLNHRSVQAECEADAPLLYILRNDLSQNGPKFGCGLGQCGACTVLMDGEPARSCVVPVGAVGSAHIETLDGLAANDKLDPLQTAFLETQAAQCGYCTNGMIMTAKALLAKNHNPDEAAIRDALSGNLCRCGIHNRIVAAIRKAATGIGQ